mmetsp:Transcript_80736/g.140131  ORF Transcript_80736/g.140131 Transcript_80736/m.140131 type:complete len:241 (-) Transcript_80736:28-750(-)
MNAFTRNNAGVMHPNAVIARRELERQERSRLRRLSEVRPSSSSGPSWNRPSSRGPGGSGGLSSRCSRPSSRPPSAQAGSQRDDMSTSWQPPTSWQPTVNGRRSRSETGPRLRTSFMLSAQRRLEDAYGELQVNSAEHENALREELQGWYFGGDGEGAPIASPEFLQETGDSAGSTLYGSSATWGSSAGNAGTKFPMKPAVDILEEAAAAVRVKITSRPSSGSLSRGSRPLGVPRLPVATG